MTFIITHPYASYRIAGGSSSSHVRGAGESRIVGDLGTGGAQGRGTRRRSSRVRGPPAYLIRKRQALEHPMSLTL